MDWHRSRHSMPIAKLREFEIQNSLEFKYFECLRNEWNNDSHYRNLFLNGAHRTCILERSASAGSRIPMMPPETSGILCLLESIGLQSSSDSPNLRCTCKPPVQLQTFDVLATISTPGADTFSSGSVYWQLECSLAIIYTAPSERPVRVDGPGHIIARKPFSLA